MKKKKKKAKSKDNHAIIKDSIKARFLTDSESNCIKQYVYNCITGPLLQRNVKYLTIQVQGDGWEESWIGIRE